MKALLKFLDIIDNISEWTGKVIGVAVIVLMFVVTYDVTMRYFFKNPTIWAWDVSSLCLVALTFFGGGYALLRRAHVNVSIIHDRFPPRVRAAVDLITYLIFFLTCIVLVRFAAPIAWKYLITGARGESMWAPPLWIGWAIVPIGALLIGLQGLAKWIRDWFMAVRGIELESKVYTGKGKITD